MTENTSNQPHQQVDASGPNRVATGPAKFHLIANAKYHDSDYARLQLLTLLAEDPDIRTTVGQTFGDTDLLAAADVLVTYTCDLRPTDDEAQALHDFVAGGGKWIALHATNALLDFTPNGVKCAPGHDLFMQTIGSRFISHPRIEPYTVTVSDPSHPLVSGIEAFEANDELYLCEYLGEIEPLLETRFSGTFKGGYVDNEWPDDDPRLVAYLHPVEHGCVYYLTLGHCCGIHDMRPMQEVAEVVRGSWENPIFLELLRRAINWSLPTAAA